MVSQPSILIRSVVLSLLIAVYSTCVMSSAMALSLSKPPTTEVAAAPQAAPAIVSSQDNLAKAKAFFQRYQAMEHDFDGSLAYLYRNDAQILVTVYHDQEAIQRFRMSGIQFKENIHQLLMAAEADQEAHFYHNLAFYPAKENHVIILGKRSSKKHPTPMPYSMMVGPDPHTGAWRIVEEQIESHVIQ